MFKVMYKGKAYEIEAWSVASARWTLAQRFFPRNDQWRERRNAIEEMS